MKLNFMRKLFETQTPTFLALIILVTGGVVCMAVVSLLKLEQFFEQGTNINSIRKRMTPIFVFTGSVIIRASWLQLAISVKFFWKTP